ncbi:MAG: Txe/YoeB family addiction module toxin [Clostridia bacterium]|nr:Txe/YoeB family addiction module toxin [Clostridia bacterium]
MYWQTRDKKILKRINQLLQDIERNGYNGIGKPEPLRGDLSGFWSRRIDDEHRIVYRVTEDRVEIIQCRGHYDD